MSRTEEHILSDTAVLLWQKLDRALALHKQAKRSSAQEEAFAHIAVDRIIDALSALLAQERAITIRTMKARHK